ncbi:MAG TPA: hypothetical protein VGR43_09440 [Dehalococcoidia bacterium]|jgi:hypothetical protein|nr:hypothetical protein [Dehalococcoidia bacterium]
MSLDEQEAAIESRDDFVRFARALLADFRENGETWENGTLERYLESLAAWVEAMDRVYRNRGETLPSQPSWRMLGEILYAASMYE